MPPETEEPPTPDRGTWLLIIAIFFAFGIIPLIIYYRPPNLPFLITYLVLPLAPAALLATIAVYVTTTR